MIEGKRLWWAVAAVWLATAIVTLAISWPRFGPLLLRDPDDAMRLLQVRDFLAGQSWFDVSQHRVNPPIGGPMHWSRLVDLPIAALILLFRPLGQALAERIAMGIEPLLLLGALFAAATLYVRRVTDQVTALLAAMLLALSMPILFQFMPLRIDHHGWQILMMAIGLWASFDPRAGRGGIIAGCAMAVWLHVSSEGLPSAALFGGVFGLRWLFDAAEGRRLALFAGTLTAGSTFLLVATHGFSGSLVSYCDAMSPVYLVPLLAVSILLAGGLAVSAKPWPWRMAVLILAAAVGGSLFLHDGGPCLAGPFATLDPLVYKYWYLHILEGRPIWDQTGTVAGITLLPPLAGIAGAVWAARTSEGAVRQRWISVLLLMLGALLVAMLVMRSMAMADLAALPGNAWLMIRLYRPIAGSSRAYVRVLGTSALFLLTPMGLAAIAAVATGGAAEQKPPPPAAGECDSARGLAALTHVAPATVFAPLDLGPNILLYTPAAVVGTSHHRNKAGMRAVIAGFMQQPQAARATIAQVHAHYVAMCPDMNELAVYAHDAPGGLAAALTAGRVPTWLRPVTTGTSLKLYAVNY